MLWWEILLIALAGFILLFIVYLGIKRIRYNIVMKKISDAFEITLENPSIKELKCNDVYQMEVESEKKYLVKLIDMNPRYEIIITNADRVVINADVKDWKRSTKPHFVSGIRRFMSHEKDNKNLVKIILIYPGCHNITKYINESDVFKAKKHQKIDGLYFIKFADFEEFIKNH